jgi:hypothetical protein
LTTLISRDIIGSILSGDGDRLVGVSTRTALNKLMAPYGHADACVKGLFSLPLIALSASSCKLPRKRGRGVFSMKM